MNPLAQPKERQTEGSLLGGRSASAALIWMGRAVFSYEGRDLSEAEKNSCRRLRLCFEAMLQDQGEAKEAVRSLNRELTPLVRRALKQLPEGWSRAFLGEGERVELYIRINLLEILASLAKEASLSSEKSCRTAAECTAKLFDKPQALLLDCLDSERQASLRFQEAIREILLLMLPEEDKSLFLPPLVKGALKLAGRCTQGSGWWHRLSCERLSEIAYPLLSESLPVKRMTSYRAGLEGREEEAQEAGLFFFRLALASLDADSLPLFLQAARLIALGDEESPSLSLIERGVSFYSCYFAAQFLHLEGRGREGVLGQLVSALTSSRGGRELLSRLGIKGPEGLPVPKSFRKELYRELAEKAEFFIEELRLFFRRVERSRKAGRKRTSSRRGGERRVALFCRKLAKRLWLQLLLPQLSVHKLAAAAAKKGVKASERLQVGLDRALFRLVSEGGLERWSTLYLESALLALFSGSASPHKEQSELLLFDAFKEFILEKLSLSELLERIGLGERYPLFPSCFEELFLRSQPKLERGIRASLRAISLPLESSREQLLPEERARALFEKLCSLFSDEELLELCKQALGSKGRDSPEAEWMAERIACLKRERKEELFDLFSLQLNFLLRQLRRGAPRLFSDPLFLFKLAACFLKKTALHLLSGPSSMDREEKEALYSELSQELLSLFFPLGEQELPLPEELREPLWRLLKEEALRSLLEQTLGGLLDDKERPRLVSSLLDEAGLALGCELPQGGLENKLEAFLGAAIRTWAGRYRGSLQPRLAELLCSVIEPLWHLFNRRCSRSLAYLLSHSGSGPLLKELLREALCLMKEGREASLEPAGSPCALLSSSACAFLAGFSGLRI